MTFYTRLCNSSHLYEIQTKEVVTVFSVEESIDDENYVE